MNLSAKEQRRNRVATHKIQEERIKYLTGEKRIKAVTVLFSDLEGRLQMLDYDKKFLVKNSDNLTFDGSSIRGFTVQSESDLRLAIDSLTIARACSQCGMPPPARTDLAILFYYGLDFGR
jgi:glutamine synthetase